MENGIVTNYTKFLTKMVTEGVNGYLQKAEDGAFEGILNIDGVDISPIIGMFFKENNKMYLWLKRKPLLEYDWNSKSYRKREREPRWEAYLEKQQNDTKIPYKGEFYFLHFTYSISGIWDEVLGEKKSRINFFVERMPMEKQRIINKMRDKNE